MQVSMFFTFWGLKAIQKGNLTGKGVMGKMLGVMNRGGIDRLNPSRLSFGGMGRWMFKRMMKQRKVTPRTVRNHRDRAVDHVRTALAVAVAA